MLINILAVLIPLIVVALFVSLKSSSNEIDKIDESAKIEEDEAV